MLTDYRGWTIDPTPDFFFGKYFARARIVQTFTDDREEPAMHIERDIAWFDYKDDAIDRAVRWAIVWIDANSESPDTTPVATGDGSMSQQTGLIADGLMS